VVQLYESDHDWKGLLALAQRTNPTASAALRAESYVQPQEQRGGLLEPSSSAVQLGQRMWVS